MEERRENERKGKRGGHKEGAKKRKKENPPPYLPPCPSKTPKTPSGAGGGDVCEVRVLHRAAPALRVWLVARERESARERSGSSENKSKPAQIHERTGCPASVVLILCCGRLVRTVSCGETSGLAVIRSQLRTQLAQNGSMGFNPSRAISHCPNSMDSGNLRTVSHLQMRSRLLRLLRCETLFFAESSAKT